MIDANPFWPERLETILSSSCCSLVHGSQGPDLCRHLSDSHEMPRQPSLAVQQDVVILSQRHFHLQQASSVFVLWSSERVWLERDCQLKTAVCRHWSGVLCLHAYARVQVCTLCHPLPKAHVPSHCHVQSWAQALISQGLAQTPKHIQMGCSWRSLPGFSSQLCE